MKYSEHVNTATFRNLNHDVVRTVDASGFQSKHHAHTYFSQQVGKISLELGYPVWLSSVTCSNGDVIIEY